MGVAFVYCLFLMEETNYDRHISQLTIGAGTSTEAVNEPGAITTEKPAPANASEEGKNPTVDGAAVEMGQITYPRKTYWQKLSVIDKKRPNRVLDIMWAPFKCFSLPVVVWAGFMYGTNGLVWPGILNATASPLYTGTYHFNSSDVGFAYFGAVVGMALGQVTLPNVS